MTRLALLALAACNGAALPASTTDAALDVVDLAGVYRVDSAVGNDAACGADAPIEPPAPYLQLVRVDFTQNPEPLVFTSDHFFSIRACDDAAATTCRASGLLELGQPIEGGWRTPIGGLSIVEGACTLRFYVFTALLADATLALDLVEHAEPAGDADCTVDAARTRGATMPCTGHKRITATRL